MTHYETVIGLEVHAQLLTNTKIFCGCKVVFGDAPNTHTCPVCLGLPGSLPVLNRRVVDMAVMMGRAIGCSIARTSVFARKNYFYPDLPKGYQISQYDLPLCSSGEIVVFANGAKKRIGVTRIHLEEDAGKLIHDQDINSLFDANRCGTPLMEIVSEPDMRTPQEAYAYLIALKQILGYLGICDCNMEEGSLRCDANVSIRPMGETKLGTKIELKNMNTFRGVEKALEYEILRQRDVVESGGKIVQQTFSWDAHKGCTIPMRTKESAHDYRYFPDPDLLPLIVEAERVRELEALLPELPQARRNRFMEQYGLSAEHADILTESRSVADYFEATVKAGGQPQAAANWVMGDILRILKEKQIDISDIKTSPQRLAGVLVLIAKESISASAGKRVLEHIEENDTDAQAAVDALGLAQISDTSALEETVRQILAENPKECERYKAGDTKLTSFFVGQAMKRTKGKGNPKEINSIVARLLA